jgi:flagellar hook-associated protein 3 FlgL
MRVPTNSASDTLVSQIQRLSARQAQLQTQASTGQKLFAPADNPSAMGRYLAIDNEQRQLLQYSRNGDHALQLSQATYAGLQELKKLSDRAGELGILGAGAPSADASSAYAEEVNQLLEQALQLGNTRFRNDYLFAGTAVDAPAFSATRDPQGRVTAATYDGNANRMTISLSESSGITPGTTGATNAGLRDFVNGLVALRDALAAGDSDAVRSTLPTLETGENLLVNALSEQGAVQLRIEIAQTQQKSRGDNLEKLVSAEADADLPSTLVRLSQATTAYEAALSSATRILQLSILDYLR